ncbi:MAG: molybdopterin converting factor subunit 1 [Gammaproteobacteria bacterium]|nr:MAG: molybdopterin converting factor subunit 1 [Gammaproteobacteria bacterium]
MTISVKFFARLREQTGKAEAAIPMTAGLNVADVWQQATQGMIMPDNTLCAVNMEYVNPDHSVNEGDEVAFFPPVTGG